MITAKFEAEQAFNATSPVGDTKILTMAEGDPGMELRHYQSLAEVDPGLLERYQMLGWLMNHGGAIAFNWDKAKAAAREWAQTKDFDGCWVRIREEGDDLPVERAPTKEGRNDMDNAVAQLRDLQIDESVSGLVVATPVLRGKDGEFGIHTPPSDLYVAMSISA